MKIKTRPEITLFHCMNAFKEIPSMFENCQVKCIKMACSSMTKDIHLLKAFEAGADAVLVLVCPETACRYAEGSIRAKKRVEYVKTILDEIGIDSGRLNIFNTTAKDKKAIKDIIHNTLDELETMEPDPALN